MKLRTSSGEWEARAWGELEARWGCRIHWVRSDRRTCALQLKPPDELWVRTPQHFSWKAAWDWTCSHEEWVCKRLERWREGSVTQAVPPGMGYVWVAGAWMLCKWEYTGRRWASVLRLEPEHDPPHIRICGPYTREGAERVVRVWLRRQLEQTLQELCGEAHAALQEYVGASRPLPPWNFRIRAMQTRWGSCSRDGRMRFSAALAHLPREWVKYVVYHEFAHWIHFHHGPDFYHLLDELLPQHRKWEREMKERAWQMVPGFQLPDLLREQPRQQGR